MKTAGFKWNEKRSNVAIYLSAGFTTKEAAKKAGVGERTIYEWKKKPEFLEEIDRLSLMTDIAGRAGRLRIAKRMIRKKDNKSKKDLLDWLKYAQSETDGVKLDLTTLAEAKALMADSGSSGTGKDKPTKSASSPQDSR